MITMRLDVKNLTMAFQSRGKICVVFENISFSIGDGRFVILLGPSGCGKTTLLSIIAGFQKAVNGTVELDGIPVTKPGPDRAFVFQDYALFPWMTVGQNILYPMKQQGISRSEQTERLNQLLALAHLEGFENHYPDQISGGMKQRTAFIRALACSPRVLLMDEPLGAVDYQMRQMLQEELEAIWLKDRKTVIMVTHDIEEAVYLGDRVIVMSGGNGGIIEDMRVRLDRPRDRRGHRYLDYKNHLTRVLKTALHGEEPGTEPGRGYLAAL